MKMSTEDYNRIVETFEANRDVVLEHYNRVKESGKYNVLESRVGWDCLRSFLGTPFISNQYDKGLNDTHITTAVVKAVKHVLENK